ncbi:hypothetical protein RHDC4_01499 [Rhodocyclaceae bacterium]|nr:hypothetical protein RHDC4_01499 [Rhodocyclaceae bacterium]
MNVLIVDPSVVPDTSYQHRIVQHFSDATDIGVRFATGILQATWQIRDFQPDVIVFDRIEDCDQIGKVIATLRRINPDAVMFQLDGDRLIATANPCGAPAQAGAPHWLQDIAWHWTTARQGAGAAIAAGGLA